MRFRYGLITGFATGYYLGAKAGHERYDQLNRVIRSVRGSDAYRVATEAVRETVETGVERVSDLVEDRRADDDRGADVAYLTPTDLPKTRPR